MKRTVTFAELEKRAWHQAKRRQARHNIGRLDHSPMSYDRMLATARAWRLLQRLQGRRISMYQAIKE